RAARAGVLQRSIAVPALASVRVGARADPAQRLDGGAARTEDARLAAGDAHARVPPRLRRRRRGDCWGADRNAALGAVRAGDDAEPHRDDPADPARPRRRLEPAAPRRRHAAVARSLARHLAAGGGGRADRGNLVVSQHAPVSLAAAVHDRTGAGTAVVAAERLERGGPAPAALAPAARATGSASARDR